jgi:hypothetical protein
VDLGGGTVRRIRYSAGNQPPTAVDRANPDVRPAAARGAVQRDAVRATRTAGDVLTYQWDFTNDGTYDAVGGTTATFTYTSAGTYTAKLRVTDGGGLSDTNDDADPGGHDPPTAVIDTPAGRHAGRPATRSASPATPPTRRTATSRRRTAAALELVLQHCSTGRRLPHARPADLASTGPSGSFVGPDHEYPSYLELKLTATDSGGLSSTVTRRLDPKTVNLTFNSVPSGLSLTVGSDTAVTPFTRTVIQGSTQSLSAPTPVTLNSTDVHVRLLVATAGPRRW